MSRQKKILLTLPDSLISDVDSLAREENTTRNDIIREAMTAYVAQQRENELRRGYSEMAEINSEIAEICFEADCEQLCRYEEKLAECEH